MKRLAVTDAVRLTDGAGHIADGLIASLGRNALGVDVTQVTDVPMAPPIHLRAPVADRDRMLWLAEKAAELGVASWQVVRFRRSASVSPRGEGAAFADKVRARMVSALEQSGGAWLPTMLPDVTLDVIVFGADQFPIVLDITGEPIGAVASGILNAAPVLLVGPEGGMEPAEFASLIARGWQSARLAATTLRFETAGISALAVVRALHVPTSLTER